MAFTLKERQILGIHGLLPPNVCTPDEQKQRVMNNVRRFSSDLDKYIYLVALLDRNEKLFYQVSRSPTHTHPDHQTSFINFLHPLRSTASSWFTVAKPHFTAESSSWLSDSLACRRL